MFGLKNMKIALLSRWNTSCGVSLHAELIGREWIKMGHDLIVFAPNNIRPVGKDENFVIRCYSDEGNRTRTFFHPEPFLENDYDVFVAQRLEWCPIEHLYNIFHEIKGKAKAVYVVHERKPPTNPIFYKFEWDAVVCFDDRYVNQWSKIEKFKGKIHKIPYPTGPLKVEDKQKARSKLMLDLEDKIVFSYGWAPELHVIPILPALKDVSKIVDFKYIVLVDPDCKVNFPELDFIEVYHKRATMDEIYSYLHASDACILHKEKHEVRKGEAVVSSSVLMCLGSLTPILTSDTEFVSFLKGEVIKYKDLNDLKRKLIGILKREIDVNKVRAAAKKYVMRNSPKVIAKRFIELFNSI